jgi:hypothetical protein
MLSDRKKKKKKKAGQGELQELVVGKEVMSAAASCSRQPLGASACMALTLSFFVLLR